jgi:hypothetical protein
MIAKINIMVFWVIAHTYQTATWSHVPENHDMTETYILCMLG